jgi:hypothetical protein
MNEESEYSFNIEINPIKANRFYNINQNEIFCISNDVKLDIFMLRIHLLRGSTYIEGSQESL